MNRIFAKITRSAGLVGEVRTEFEAFRAFADGLVKTQLTFPAAPNCP
jgi:hypothetical protein